MGQPYNIRKEKRLTREFSAGGGIDTFDISDPAAIKSILSKKYPGRDDGAAAPQEQARPHEAILDPTGDFLVFPDLGADLIRVLAVDKATLQYTEKVCKSPASRVCP